MSGFITIERDLWNHPLFAPAPMTEREAWVWMIAQAAWAETRHRVGNELVTVPRGSFMATLREMQSVFMWGSDKRVRTFLKTLEKEGMIGRTTLGTRNAPKTQITIRNYDEYQSIGRTKDAPKTQDRTHHGRTTDAVKNHTNHINQEESKDSLSPTVPKKASPTGSRLPADWMLSKHLGEWSIEKGATECLIRSEADKFKDYWLSVPAAKGRKADWDATWRNWIRRAIENNPAPKMKTINGGHNGQHNNNRHSDPALEQIARLAGISGTSGNGGF